MKKVIRAKTLGVWVVLVLLCSGCTSFVSFDRVHKLCKSALAESRTLAANGKYKEAVALMYPVHNLHPKDPLFKSVYAELDVKHQHLLDSRLWLGHNLSVSRAQDEEAGVFTRVFWYLPDRFLDVLDLGSLEVNAGPQFGFGFWITRPFSLDWYGGHTYGLGLYQKRNPGLQKNISYEFALFKTGITDITAGVSGLAADESVSDEFDYHEASRPLYQNYRDYWAIGARGGLVGLGAKAELHPLEFLDLLAGFFFFDPMDDDLGPTKPLDISPQQRAILRELTALTQETDVTEYRKRFPALTKIENLLE